MSDKEVPAVKSQRFQHFHSARPPEPVTSQYPGGAAHLVPPFFLIIVSDKHTASSSHRQSDKYPITSSERSVTSGWPGLWLGIVGCIAWRCPPQPRNKWGWGWGVDSWFYSSPCSSWLMNGQIRVKGRFIPASPPEATNMWRCIKV